MKFPIYIPLCIVLLASCAVKTIHPDNQKQGYSGKHSYSTKASDIRIHSELQSVPPEIPRFIIAQYPSTDLVNGPVAKAIKSNLLPLGFVEAPSRKEANVVVWFSYHTQLTGMRIIGEGEDIWGEQVAATESLNAHQVSPVYFSIQFVSLNKSNFPNSVEPFWRGDWSSDQPMLTMAQFIERQLGKIFAEYNSEQTKYEIAALRGMQARKLKVAVKNYVKMVMYRIRSNWKKPNYNVKGKKCKIKIIQTAAGEIQSHKVLTCDRDRRFRRSIEKAIKKSSPLPLPKEDNFERRELILIFQG